MVLNFVLPLCELLECILLGLHVTVIGQVGIISATLVLQRLDRGREVDFTFEKLLARYFIEFICWVAISGH